VFERSTRRPVSGPGTVVLRDEAGALLDRVVVGDGPVVLHGSGAAELVVRVRGFVPARLALAAEGPALRRREVLLSRGLSIEGAVRTDDGRPLAGLRVEAAGEGDRAPAPRGRTREDGSFAIRGLRAGPHLVSVRAVPRDVGLRPDPVRVEAGTRGVELCVPAVTSCRVHVRDARTGRPVDARVTIVERDSGGEERVRMAGRTRTDAGFVLHGRPGSSCRVAVRAESYRPSADARVDFVAGFENDVVVVLAPAPTALLRLRVVDERGEPLEGFALRRTFDRPSPHATVRARAAEDGRLELRLPAGRHALAILPAPGEHPDSASVVPHEFTVDVGPDRRSERVVRVRRGGWITAALGGDYLGGTLALHRDGRRLDSARWRGLGDGRVRTRDPLEPGRYELRARQRGGEELRRAVQVTAGEDTAVFLARQR